MNIDIDQVEQVAQDCIAAINEMLLKNSNQPAYKSFLCFNKVADFLIEQLINNENNFEVKIKAARHAIHVLRSVPSNRVASIINDDVENTILEYFEYVYAMEIHKQHQLKIILDNSTFDKT